MMNDQERIRAERKKLKNEYGQLFDVISEILFRYDPIRINFDFNTDEYEPEVGTILPGLKDCNSVIDVQKMIHQEFVKWFSIQDAGEENDYKAIAGEVWEVWRDHKYPWIKAEVTFLSTSEGGRKYLLDLGDCSYYRPHIVVGDSSQREPILKEGRIIDEEYLGVQFRSCFLTIAPGESVIIKLELMYYLTVDYGKLIPDEEFTIRDGPKIIGYGRVLEIGKF